MILLCKKSYPGLIDDKFQSFLKGKIYRLERCVFYHDDTFYRVFGRDEKFTELFSQDEFEEYFDDLAKIRREKLKKINAKVK